MTRGRNTVALTAAVVMVSSYAIRADVKTDQRSRVEFAGALGRIVNIFGGKGAREGVTSSIAVQGDRLAKMSDTTGQIIDLGEEKIYDLDFKRKQYTVTTFAELRRRLEEAQRKAEERSLKADAREAKRDQKAGTPKDRDPNQNDVEVDFSLKETGQTKNVNGFDTREIVMTITLREKGKTLEEGGGMVLTNDMWMAPKVAALREVAEFYQRYALKLQGPMMAGASAQDLAAAMAMYPMMKDAMARMNSENVKMDGTAISSTVTMDAVKSADEMAQEAKQKDDDSSSSGGGGIGGGVSGLLGGLAKKAAQKKSDGGQHENEARTTFMTLTNEVLKMTTSVSAADMAIPAGFKENR
jgi:hypothetical protein